MGRELRKELKDKEEIPKQGRRAVLWSNPCVSRSFVYSLEHRLKRAREDSGRILA